MDFYYFEIAAEFAARRKDRRHYIVGAAGIRKDGVLVVSRNSPTHNVNPDIHAEARLCDKLTPNSVVYVARWLRGGGYANAQPCVCCEARLRAAGVKRVYYTMSWDQGPLENNYGVLKLR